MIDLPVVISIIGTINAHQKPQSLISDPLLVSLCMTGLILVKNVIAHRISARIISNNEERLGLNFIKKIKLRLCFWKFLYYTFSALYGFSVLKNSNWVLKKELYIIRYIEEIPFQYRIYYFISISYYINEAIALFIEPKRKDFFQMLLHHISTLMLLGYSYKTGFIRYGVSILFLHDISDPFLELAKLFVYIKHAKIANFVFAIFMTVFIVSRLFVYPIFFVYPCNKLLFESGICMEYAIMGGSLIALFIMHIIWSYYIIKILIRVLKEGKGKDARSEEQGL